MHGHETVAAALARQRFAPALGRARRTLLALLLGAPAPDAVWTRWLRALPRRAVPNAACWSARDALLASRVFRELPNLRPARDAWGDWTGAPQSMLCALLLPFFLLRRLSCSVSLGAFRRAVALV